LEVTAELINKCCYTDHAINMVTVDT